jgi:hypothetical protein
MRVNLEHYSHYAAVAGALNVIGLLQLILDISCNFLSQKYSHLAIHETVHQFYLSKQGEHITTKEYLEPFTNN